MKVGVFGGSFNPPHRGHLLAARAAVNALGLECLYVVPAKEPPHKALPDGSPPAAERYRLTELLFADEPLVTVSGLELQRDGVSYTIDTVAALKARHPNAAMYLLLGTDMFLSLAEWYRAAELLTMVTPAVFARAGGQDAAIAAQAERLRAEYGVDAQVIDHEVFEVSSTELRDLLANRQGAELMGAAVYSEVIRSRHYGAKPVFAWLLEQVAACNPRRAAHTAGTAEEAVKLARRWGVDAEQAEEAALLHDITKGLDPDTQLRLCKKYDMMPDDVERENPKLLHAVTGAGMARAEFGVCDAVFDAILCHTTGRPRMTMLDKVLYVADYIEPNRDFTEVGTLRELAYTDLDAAVAFGLELTARELRAKGAAVHPRSIEALEHVECRV
ncbi:MAG: bis(5'-nucleosyl)-tetraphosphatase (symmetrical) YqeK [Oscillospiraceae bacterium]|nr:bis(5'-nucleosyl)-tetraphosphatase (symmetrical) YqeK [Oscillospiraceae bacterium]